MHSIKAGMLIVSLFTGIMAFMDGTSIFTNKNKPLTSRKEHYVSKDTSAPKFDNPNPTAKQDIWIDADAAVGMERQSGEGYSDVDDGYAILQLLLAEEVNIHGISAVFGNTSIDNAYKLCQKMSSEFAGYDIPVFKGAGQSMDLNNLSTNPAVEAMAQALKEQKLRILAIGPATNVGILLLKYPELKDRIREVVLVAGRRSPEAHFTIGNKGYRARDFNFEQDPDAFQVILQSQVPVTLCPFEISSKVRITEKDLNRLAQAGDGAQWLAKNSRPWLQQWIERGETGFHPFDVLASHYIIQPNDIISEPLNARLEIYTNDAIDKNGRQVFKHYLINDHTEGTPIKYCYDVEEGYHEALIHSLTN